MLKEGAGLAGLASEQNSETVSSEQGAQTMWLIIG